MILTILSYSWLIILTAAMIYAMLQDDETRGILFVATIGLIIIIITYLSCAHLGLV